MNNAATFLHISKPGYIPHLLPKIKVASLASAALYSARNVKALKPNHTDPRHQSDGAKCPSTAIHGRTTRRLFPRIALPTDRRRAARRPARQTERTASAPNRSRASVPAIRARALTCSSAAVAGSRRCRGGYDHRRSGTDDGGTVGRRTRARVAVPPDATAAADVVGRAHVETCRAGLGCCRAGGS